MLIKQQGILMMTIHFSITFSAGLQHKYSPAKPNFQKAILLFFSSFLCSVP